MFGDAGKAQTSAMASQAGAGAPPSAFGSGLLSNVANFAASNAMKKQPASAAPQTLLGAVGDNASKTLLGS